jgi:hypothetical protein
MMTMSCDLSRQRLQHYLEGRLSAEEARQVQEHVQACETCQSVQLLEPQWTALLRQRLRPEPPGAEFRSRLRGSLNLARADESTAEPPQSKAFVTWLASPWMPRLAMVLVLGFVVLVPLRGLFHAPLLAQEAVRSHVLHVPTCDGPLPACCTDLALGVGQSLPDPSAGRRIPDLRSLGLALIVTSHCRGPIEVSRLCYRDAEGALFSLYITDRVTEQFQALHPRELRGMSQEHYRVEGSEVTLWEQGGLVHFWIGPRGSSHYHEALEILQRREEPVGASSS